MVTYVEKMTHLESRGNYSVVNRAGYAGKFQLGAAALNDAKDENGESYYKCTEEEKGGRRNTWKGTWSGKDGINSLSDFLDTEQGQRAQDKAIAWYTATNWKRINKSVKDEFLGQTIRFEENGQVVEIEVTKAALLAAAHLKGSGTVNKAFRAMLDNPRDHYDKDYFADANTDIDDGNGTTIFKYMQEMEGVSLGPELEKLIGDEVIVASASKPAIPETPDPQQVEALAANYQDKTNASPSTEELSSAEVDKEQYDDRRKDQLADARLEAAPEEQVEMIKPPITAYLNPLNYAQWAVSKVSFGYLAEDPFAPVFIESPVDVMSDGDVGIASASEKESGFNLRAPGSPAIGKGEDISRSV